MENRNAHDVLQYTVLTDIFYSFYSSFYPDSSKGSLNSSKTCTNTTQYFKRRQLIIINTDDKQHLGKFKFLRKKATSKNTQSAMSIVRISRLDGTKVRIFVEVKTCALIRNFSKAFYSRLFLSLMVAEVRMTLVMKLILDQVTPK